MLNFSVIKRMDFIDKSVILYVSSGVFLREEKDRQYEFNKSLHYIEVCNFLQTFYVVRFIGHLV